MLKSKDKEEWDDYPITYFISFWFFFPPQINFNPDKA